MIDNFSNILRILLSATKHIFKSLLNFLMINYSFS